MIPARLDFPCRTNADYTEELALVDGATPVDLTGYSFNMSVKLSADSTSQFDLATVTTDIQGLRIIEAAGGIIGLHIDWETLSAAYDAVVGTAEQGNPVNLLYDMKFIYPSGEEDIWFVGIVTIDKGITNG